MSRVYSYIGAACLNTPEPFYSTRYAKRELIAIEGDLFAALRQAQLPNRSVPIIFTYIIDANGLLWVADRHSEHVACARGKDVLSAGEMTVEIDNGKVIVTDISNQSTGYCPEPESWPAVAAALDKAEIPHPDSFTRSFLFRLCEGCGQTNIVKEGDFTCAVCGAELKQEWNCSYDTKWRKRTRRASAE